MLSRHSSADSRWVRWNARPNSPRKNTEEKESWMRVIRLIMDFNHKFLSRNQMF